MENKILEAYHISQWGQILSKGHASRISQVIFLCTVYDLLNVLKNYRIREKDNAIFESIWLHSGAPAWYKLWYTFACNLRISFICYFQRETQFSCYISRCQLDDFLLQSGHNFVNLKCQVVEMCNMRPILCISTSWHVKFLKLRPFFENRLIETPNVIFREKHNLAATYHYAARLWQVLIYSLFIYKVE